MYGDLVELYMELSEMKWIFDTKDTFGIKQWHIIFVEDIKTTIFTQPIRSTNTKSWYIGNRENLVIGQRTKAFYRN